MTISMSTPLVPNQGNKPAPAQQSKPDLAGLIEMLDLSDLQKHFMRSRWLEQVNWMGAKAKKAQKRYFALRLTTIIGGVILPILVSLNFNNNLKAADAIRWLIISLGLVFAVSSGVE